MDSEDYSEFDEHPRRPSKSSQKRDSEALQSVGEALIALPRERLTEFDLPPDLLEAVTVAQTLSTHRGAYKRQRKYIGKLLRDIDATPISEKLASLNQQSAEAIHAQHLIERWRDRLLAGDDHDINALMAEHPDADRQKLRQLVRDGRKERQEAAAPRAARLLFRYLRELQQQTQE
ncbi:ribosome biogenesis factor YjgA [Methylococcus sp. EFPC2]|uniref:ribosome biogenesis factor YjgA n=1 Tax=Methylococcus sp. EFPC2 TaxID=2812648 RepID=UPI0019678D68|nr:ribosome biogenesis factor YjgA [Methylococcus sp. EFPC2]QSA96728.1 DUF615 domain-containing protein [Methylococcus sp. EFPC2]